MKRTMWAYSAALSLVGAGMAQAGSLTYHAINSDADSNISTSNTYTTAVNYGGSDVTINGVTFVNGAGNLTASLTAGNATLSVDNGTLANANFIFYTSPIADGENVKTLLQDYIYNTGDGTFPESVALSGLTAGKTYDFRVYVRPIGVAWNRPVTMNFTGDGSTTSLVGFWDDPNGQISGYNEDAPNTVGFANPDQAYYINYNFTYDGVSTPGFNSTSSFGGQALIMYGVSNQEVVPEPASLGLLAGAGLLLARRRR